RTRLRERAMRVTEEESFAIRLDRTQGNSGRACQRRRRAPLKICVRPLEARERRQAFAHATRRADGEQLTETALLFAQLITRRRAQIFIRQIRDAGRAARKTRARARHVEAALEREIEGELFVDGQTILKADDGEAVRAVRAVLQLITTTQSSVVPKLRLDADGRFAPRTCAREAGRARIADGHNRRSG